MAGFVPALLKVRSSNLMKIANAVETEAQASSVYRQGQRFLNNEYPVSVDFLKLLKLRGRHKILIDRTEWKFGERWVNILMLSVAYQGTAIPLLWEVAEHKGNATAAEHVAIIKRCVAQLGVERIEAVYADREFGSYELLKYLTDEEIDFYIRLKASHLADGESLKKRMKGAAEQVKMRGKVKVKVFGLEMYVSGVKYQKKGKTEHLLIASREKKPNAFKQYRFRWQIETMFGSLKSRGFDFEETHLTMPEKISKMVLLLGLGLCLALRMGKYQVQEVKAVKMKVKNNGRLAKSLFRIGLDALQNILFNLWQTKKRQQWQAFINLLSCA